MTLLTTRQKIVSGNIANQNTPGYRTKDLDFEAELANSMSAGAPRAIEVGGLAMKTDGNNVTLDREAHLLAENALRFNVASNLMRSQIRLVRTALDESKQ